MENISHKMILISILYILVTEPTFAMGISISLGDARDDMAISDTYKLSTDTALKSESTLDGHYIYQDRQLYGDDDNTLVHYVGGNGYNSKNVVESLGPLRISTSSTATSQSASISQAVMGTGNIFAELQGTQGSDFVDQKTNVIDGDLSLSQSLAAGNLLSASQETEMSGSSCYLESSSLSSSNAMLANGIFYKVEDIKADLTAASQGKAWTMGEISAYGDNCLDEDTLRLIGSESMGLSFDSSYVKEGEDTKTAPIFKGSVQANAVNMDRDVFDSAPQASQVQSSTELESQTYGGQVGDFWGWLPLGNIYDGTTARRWNQANPTIQLYLLTDANYYAEGLNTNSVCAAIQTAANLWDAATYQRLFASTVIASSSVSRDVQDWISVHSWENIGAYNGVYSPGHAHTWYTTSSQKDGFFQITDSDVDYNTYYSWNTNGNSGGTNYDIETIAVHELGHTLGLADLYNKENAPLYKAQVQQIMNYQYNHPLWLGNGDRQAIWNMYGR
jgi:hypothetical protein